MCGTLNHEESAFFGAGDRVSSCLPAFELVCLPLTRTTAHPSGVMS